MSSKAPYTITQDRIDAADKQIRLNQKEIRFDTRDFPVETIVSRFQADTFLIPLYQREFVWSQADQSEFIESVIMGLPIPMMFLAEDELGTFEIVDGAQRIQTLVAFVMGDLTLKKLTKLTSINGFQFKDLPAAQRNKLTSRALRLVILDQDTTDEFRQDLFNRINKSGKKLLPSERRRGAFDGKFVTFLQKCAEDPVFTSLCPITEKMVLRQEPLELITRFFAYSEKYLDFRHDVDSFLDQFVEEHRSQYDHKRYINEFRLTMKFIRQYFPYGFAKTPNARTTPRVRFEAISVGVNLALRKQPDLMPLPVISWLDSAEFIEQTTTHASNSAPRMRGRIEFVRNRLLEGQ